MALRRGGAYISGMMRPALALSLLGHLGCHAHRAHPGHGHHAHGRGPGSHAAEHGGHGGHGHRFDDPGRWSAVFDDPARDA